MNAIKVIILTQEQETQYVNLVAQEEAFKKAWREATEALEAFTNDLMPRLPLSFRTFTHAEKDGPLTLVVTQK